MMSGLTEERDLVLIKWSKEVVESSEMVLRGRLRLFNVEDNIWEVVVRLREVVGGRAGEMMGGAELKVGSVLVCILVLLTITLILDDAISDHYHRPPNLKCTKSSRIISKMNFRIKLFSFSSTVKNVLGLSATTTTVVVNIKLT